MLQRGTHATTELDSPRERLVRPTLVARRRSALPRSRGLTLIEILIVLVLIIATAAIAIPAMTQRFENTRFDATVDQIVATLALARAESQRERRPVQIMWDPAERVVYAAWLDVTSLNSEEEDGPDSPGSDVVSRIAPDSDETSAGDYLNAVAAIAPGAVAIGGSRLRVRLPDGCRIQTMEASEEEQSEESAPSDALADLERPDESIEVNDGSVISLIVYMPDGSTFAQASFTIVDSGGRQSRVVLNPWTGQAAISRVELSRSSPLPGSSPLEDSAPVEDRP